MYGQRLGKDTSVKLHIGNQISECDDMGYTDKREHYMWM